jgi:hypothetical protein
MQFSEKILAEITAAVERWINGCVYLNQTLLVSELLEKDIFSYDDIECLEAYPEHGFIINGNSLFFHGGGENAKNSFIAMLEEKRKLASSISYKNGNAKEQITAYLTTVEDLDNAIDDMEHLETESQESYEWWAISDWLADKLIGINEPVLRNNYGVWWGRTTTGVQLGYGDGLYALAEQTTTEKSQE